MGALKSGPAAPRSDSASTPNHSLLPAMQRGRLIAVHSGGDLVVDAGIGRLITCDVLLNLQPCNYREGDQVLVFVPVDPVVRGVVLGRIGLHSEAKMPLQVSIEAAESLSLKCGNASIDLHTNGQVLIKGEDVTLRAKGTQAIRAGNVSIN